MILDRTGHDSVLLPLEIDLSVDHLIHLNVKFKGVEFRKSIKVIYSTSYPLGITFFSVLPMLMAVHIK